MQNNKQQVTKLEAARRQLNVAIELWFYDKDSVSIHTLAFAAYDIIRFISKKRGRKIELIWDSKVIKDEFRQEFCESMKKYGVFFKHADRDPDAVIEFPIEISEMYILFTIFGLESMGEKQNEIESAFTMWLYLTKPDTLTEMGRRFLTNHIPIKHLAEIRNIPKSQFFQIWIAEKSRIMQRYILTDG